MARMPPPNKKPLADRSHYTWAAATPEIREYVARIIKETRLQRDVDPGQAADACGISRAAWYRWERGDVGATTALIIWWLFKDPSNTMDGLYWRERAILAEEALKQINSNIVKYRYNKEDFIEDGSRPRKRSTGNHNGSSPQRT